MDKAWPKYSAFYRARGSFTLVAVAGAGREGAQMSHTKSVIIQAPLNRVFAAAADLARWPEFLPHIRYNRFVTQAPSGGKVKMACSFWGISLTWLSMYQMDTAKYELHFRQVPRGMESLWRFAELPDGGVEITVTHQRECKWPLVGTLIAKWLAGRFLIERIDEKTLAGLKRKVEARQRLTDQAEAISAPSARPLAPPAGERNAARTIPTKKATARRSPAAQAKPAPPTLPRRGRSASKSAIAAKPSRARKSRS